MLAQTGRTLVAGAISAPFLSLGREAAASGAVVGEETGAQAGRKVLAEGGNAIDAAVAAALTSCVAAPARCGLAGYGGAMTIALARSRKVISIDFNTSAPAAARGDMFPLDEKGAVKDRLNFFGWLASGVPGTLAGLQLALDRYGSRSFRELVAPAIQIARNGFVITPPFARTLRGAAERFRNDPGSARVYLKDGEPLAAGEMISNPEAAALLTTLAERNSTDSFYRGDIAQRVAEAFQKNGGLVTAKDLAAYHAREVEPLRVQWRDCEICTAPLTAGGLTILEAITVLKELGWADAASSNESVHAHLEALRLAWQDRLELLGDPSKTKVPVSRLLSLEHARELAREVRDAVREKRPATTRVPEHTEEGTNHISAVDRHGNVVALTLTHGNAFGAQVTIPGLGITLGHGMSRFDPHPGHPNSPGPGKKPLHNMSPTVVLRGRRPVFAVGGSGGVRIPNAIYDVLSHYVGRGTTLAEAVAAPRMNSVGTRNVTVEPSWPKAEVDYLSQCGFNLKTGEGAIVGAVSFDAQTGKSDSAMR
jgi:gamma-glutamyltranspeptidase/glutathione hydrolase